MKDNYVLRSDAEAQIKAANDERDLHKRTSEILSDLLDSISEPAKSAAERVTAAEETARGANARADAHAETARKATQDLADERASRSEEVDGKLRDHLAPIHMALQGLKETKHATDTSIFDGLNAKLDAIAKSMGQVKETQMAEFELEHIRDVGDRISRTRVRQTQ